VHYSIIFMKVNCLETRDTRKVLTPPPSDARSFAKGHKVFTSKRINRLFLGIDLSSIVICTSIPKLRT
jgi:hypothetical protein